MYLVLGGVVPSSHQLERTPAMLLTARGVEAVVSASLEIGRFCSARRVAGPHTCET